MPSTNAYLGSPTQDPDTKVWSLDLDEEIQTSLDSVCDLSTTIFEAKASVFIASFPQGPVLVSRAGLPFDLSAEAQQQFLETDELSDIQVNDSDFLIRETAPGSDERSGYRIVAPIVMPSDLHIGCLVFFRRSEAKMSPKEHAILSVLHRNIVRHLLHAKQVFESAKAESLQTLISENNDDWIFVKDEQFRIVYANEAFLAVYPEDKRDKIIGYTTVEEYDAAEAELFLAQDKVAFEQGVSKVIEKLHMPNGSYKIVETVKRRFEDENGKRYILGICRDMTGREDLIRELKKANDELENFTSIASHDLKSPLNAIRRLLEWIHEDCASLLPEEHRDNINLVINRANRMQTLLDDLLSYARIGQDVTESSDIVLSTLCEDIAQLLDVPDDFVISAPQKTLHLPMVPFKTVMLNLIGNAVKHNDKPTGKVEITATESKHYYLIEVRDNGPGIEPIYFDRIFKLFQTLKPRDEVEGSGIGLSVVLKYINNFSGTITVDSDGESGTTFKLSWPKRTSKL
ncbi:sensor histidine kinase [Congregibacter litoralis]|uniref:histidine kinase n=1 Tax=Congregibacter litoralis KT71 TaxID=314285 RepID=A4A4X3_9GAMM|nr:ATP-binding protein [Congregibacter litoralis]EAQ98844.1 PAS domain protein S-box [Congregibacter litoralis KT71]